MHICIYIYICICICMCVYIYIYIYICIPWYDTWRSYHGPKLRADAPLMERLDCCFAIINEKSTEVVIFIFLLDIRN